MLRKMKAMVKRYKVTTMKGNYIWKRASKPLDLCCFNGTSD